MATVKYERASGTCEIYDKYSITGDVIRNKRTGNIVSQHTTKGGYKWVTLCDNDGKLRMLLVHRIIASTFHGRPPTPGHSADHKNRDRVDNDRDNVSWKDKKEQVANREVPETYKSAFIVIRDGVEKTVDEWVGHLEGEKNHMGRPYTNGMISKYAQRKQHGFAYKVFKDLPGEQWKKSRGSWEISNMLRVRYTTKHAKNVLDVTQLCVLGGYPVVSVGKKHIGVHELCFLAFYPEEYNAKKPGEMVLHDDDDPMNFLPENLYVESRSRNGFDAHKNGKFDGKKTARKPCVSYVNGVKEKEHISLSDAAQYLKEYGYTKVRAGYISNAIENGSKSYGRTWKPL
jgi:hypothetical protein